MKTLKERFHALRAPIASLTDLRAIAGKIGLIWQRRPLVRDRSFVAMWLDAEAPDGAWHIRAKMATTSVGGSGAEERRVFAEANASAIAATVNGFGPDSRPRLENAGVTAVTNIPSVHVPAFVKASDDEEPRPYKNGYDLGKIDDRIGEPVTDDALEVRVRVDRALPLAGSSYRDVYFCAAELNGAGVRFYGDFSLVLRAISADTVILDRNSYDVERAPLVQLLHDVTGEARNRRRKTLLARMAGRWSSDVSPIAIVKVMHALGGGVRRLTTAQISEALLSDEDYIEVLRIGSFSVGDVREARMATADVGRDAYTAGLLRRGPPPSYEAMLLRHRRRRAQAALRRAGVPTTAVTTAGRVKS